MKSLTLTDETRNGYASEVLPNDQSVVSPLPVHRAYVQQVIWPPRVTEHAKDMGLRLTRCLTESSDSFSPS